MDKSIAKIVYVVTRNNENTLWSSLDLTVKHIVGAVKSKCSNFLKDIQKK